MRLILAALFSLLSFAILPAQVRINEIMQSNIDCMMDDLNEFPDSWVELYNAGTADVKLKEYSIGLTPNANEAYQLPDSQLKAQSLIVILCDKESTGLHTSFRLESGNGCAVYLFRNGTIVDKLEGVSKQHSPNISYGRKSESEDEWGYQLTPTPGKANAGIAKGILPGVLFDVPGMVYEASSSFNLSLSLAGDAPQGTEIRYTTDGSEPTERSTLYVAPFSINANRVIRAKAICKGYLSPRSITQSYLFLNREMTLPVVSIVSDQKYFYDTKIGILADGSNSNKKNYQYNWRRPINFEYFDAAGEESRLNQLCEARVQGNASRGFKIKSLALYANKRFGTKRFKYEFFPDQRPGQTNFKSISLRNAGNDFDYLYMRDAIVQRSVAQNVDLDWEAWQPAIFFLNGKYMGILNVRERSNEDNIYTNYDELEDIDMFENWHDLKAGTWDKLNDFKAFFQEHGHTWDEYSRYMDLYEYINLMVMNIFYNNLDFPGNNLTLWRPRTEDGIWRFIAKDTDYTLGIYDKDASYNYVEWLYNNNYDGSHNWANTSEATRLFRRLMDNADFAREFIDHAAIYMGDFLNYNAVWNNLWNSMYETIKTEYPHHRKLINQWWPNYNEELTKAQTWMKKRPDYLYKFLADKYSLGTPIEMSINTTGIAPDDADFHITFNDIPLHERIFNGKYYPHRQVTLSTTLSDLYQVDSWELIRIGNGGTVQSTHHEGTSHSFTMPDCKSLKVIAHIAPKTDAIHPLTPATETTATDFYDARGVRHSSLQKGINIVRMKDGSVKKIMYR